MDNLQKFAESLAYTLAYGLILGALFHYINLAFLKIHNKKIWYSMVGLWLLLAIINFFIPKFIASSEFKYLGQSIILLGIISLIKLRKKN